MATIRRIQIEHDGEWYIYNPNAKPDERWSVRYEEHPGHYGWDSLKSEGEDYFKRSVPEEAKRLVENLR